MNKFSRDYCAYKVLLESDLTNKQRETLLMNEDFKDAVGSVVDTVKGFFGFGKKLGPGAEILSKNPDFVKNIEALKKPLSAAVKNMTLIAKKMNIPNPKGATAAILTQILNDEGLSDEDITNQEPIPAPRKGRYASSMSDYGSTIRSRSSNATSALIRGAAEVQDAPIERTEELVAKAEEKNVSPQRAAVLLGNAISTTTGVPAKDCVIIVSTLIDIGKLNTNNQTNEGLRASSKDLLIAVNEINNVASLYERWQLLSNANKLLIEAPTKSLSKNDYAALTTKIENGEIGSEEQLNSFIQKLIKKGKNVSQQQKNDALKALKQKMANAAFAEYDKSVAKEKKRSAKEKKSAADQSKSSTVRKGKNKPDTSSAEKSAASSEQSSSEDINMPKVSSDLQQTVKKAQEEFATAFNLLVKKLKGKVDIGNIGKVLVALDELESLEVQRG